MSRALSEHAVDHVVLERGEIGNSWRHERWDSLRLLTPNWLSRLPDRPYRGPEPDGFMTMPEVVGLLTEFAAGCRAPVRTQTAVTGVQRIGREFRLQTASGALQCRTLVLASGACNLPQLPALRSAVPPRVQCLSALEYRRPDQLPPGGVLIVGASASGVQLADEICRSGREVTLSVGEHVRLPRTYRGRDVLWWMQASGVWDERYEQIEDLERARSLPSPQLSGARGQETLDINALARTGVRIVGRLSAIRSGRAFFSGGLRNLFTLADLKLERLLERFDAWARARGEEIECAPPERFEPTREPAAARLWLDLDAGEIGSILWATGFRPDYRWLDVPVLDDKGRLRHDGGVIRDAPGMYALGLPLLRRRKSTFIHGAEDDARELAAHLLRYLEQRQD
jgi:putative flavoprotein involved in K+ transport